MRTRYGKLFGVHVAHTFYTDRRCDALTMEPTAQCRRTLARYRLVLKQAPTELRVLVPHRVPAVAEEGGVPPPDPWVPLAETVTFDFLLRLKDRRLLNFTAPPDDPDPKKHPGHSTVLYSNDGLQPRLVESHVVTTDGPLPELDTGDGNALRLLVLSNAAGDELLSEIVPVLGDIGPEDDGGGGAPPRKRTLQPTFTLRGYPEGYYRLSEPPAEGIQIFRRDRTEAGWFGLVHIQLDAGAAQAGNPPEFEIRMEARSAPWVYDVQLSKRKAATQYRMLQLEPKPDLPHAEGAEAGAGGDGGAGAGEPHPAAPAPPAAPELYFSDPEIIEQREDGSRTIRFRTVTEEHSVVPADVTYRQIPRPRIALQMQSGPPGAAADGAIRWINVLEDLPNPPPDNAEPRITIRL